MQELIAKLRAHRLSVTPQRLAILGALEGRYDHPTAEQLFREVQGDIPMISFNTVYKTLEVFYQKGLAIKVNPLHAAARYDGATHPHAHMICRQCQKVLDLAGEVQELSFPPEALQGFKVENQSLVLWGLCPGCQGL